MNTRNAVNQFDKTISKLLASTQTVALSSILGTKSVNLHTLIEHVTAAGKPVIFTFTPGPFKTSEELPVNWMTTTQALGCSLQLQTFEANFTELGGVVIAVNKQTAGYQAGPNGLLDVKKLPSLKMISDVNNTLEEELELSAMKIQVNEVWYFKRFTIVINADKNARGFLLQSPVNQEIADKHIADIKEFIALTKAARPQITAAI
jgi:peroxiredoxin